MPEATIRFLSPAGPSELRRILSDLSFVASNVPQVLSVEKTGETTALWTVQVKLGPMTRKSVYQGELLEANDARVRFRAQGPEATIEGTLSFTAATPSGTDVALTLSMKGNGPLRAVVDAYLGKRVREDAEKFAQGLANRVGGPPTATT
jgi:carbon monoxide dehydrogenase subunit G